MNATTSPNRFSGVPPERIVPRQVTVYDRERQCLAPGCGEWFDPTREDKVWCSDACRIAVHRARRVARGTDNGCVRIAVAACHVSREEG